MSDSEESVISDVEEDHVALDPNNPLPARIGDEEEFMGKTIQEYSEKLAEYEEAWIPKDTSIEGMIQSIENVLEKEIKSISIPILQSIFRKRAEEITILHAYYNINCLKSTEEGPEFARRIDLLAQFNYTMHGVCANWALAKNTLEGDDNRTHFPYINLFLKPYFNQKDLERRSDAQVVSDFLIEKLFKHKCMRYMDRVYYPRYINGQFTFSYEPGPELRDWIWENIDKATEPHYYHRLTRQGNVANDVAKILSRIRDVCFPELKKRSTHVSFRNGVYITCKSYMNDRNDLFIPHEQPSEYLNMDDGVSHLFIDLDFVWTDQPFTEIKTPYFDTLIKYQNLDAETVNIMYAMMGRMGYKMDDLDRWQVAPMVKGAGGTGKSTLIKLLSDHLYEKIDVGTLTNNIEVKFGLSAFINTKAIFAPEIDDKLSLSRTDFLAIISGDTQNIARKGLDPCTIKWDQHMMICGNKYLPYDDAGGSLSRRLVMFEWMKKVDTKKSIQNLDVLLHEEYPLILQKINRAYLHYASKYGNKNVETFLTPYLLEMRSKINMNNNPLKMFLSASSDLVYDPSYYLPESVLSSAYKEFCQANGYAVVPWKSDLYREAFDERRLKLTPSKEKRKYPPNENGTNQVQFYVEGIDMAKYHVKEESDSDEDEDFE